MRVTWALLWREVHTWAQWSPTWTTVLHSWPQTTLKQLNTTRTRLSPGPRMDETSQRIYEPICHDSTNPWIIWGERFLCLNHCLSTAEVHQQQCRTNIWFGWTINAEICQNIVPPLPKMSWNSFVPHSCDHKMEVEDARLDRLYTTILPRTHTSTHTLHGLQRSDSHTQKGWRTEICTVMPLLEVWCQTPCGRRCEQRRGGQDREKSQVMGQLCNLYYKHGWTLTLHVQLICVSIPLAAVQTSPGFTVHSLLQNYSSSM